MKVPKNFSVGLSLALATMLLLLAIVCPAMGLASPHFLSPSARISALKATSTAHFVTYVSTVKTEGVTTITTNYVVQAKDLPTEQASYSKNAAGHRVLSRFQRGKYLWILQSDPKACYIRLGGQTAVPLWLKQKGESYQFSGPSQVFWSQTTSLMGGASRSKRTTTATIAKGHVGDIDVETISSGKEQPTIKTLQREVLSYPKRLAPSLFEIHLPLCSAPSG